MFSGQEIGTRSERAKMYSEVPQTDSGHDEKTTEESIDFYSERLAFERRLRYLKMWIYSLASLLTLLMLLLLYTTTAASKAKSTKSWQPTPVPDFPKEVVSFEEYPLFAAGSNEKSDVAWQSMMPQGDGFVLVPDAEQYPLEPGKNTTEGPLYDITLFHQLHCLKHIRTFLFTIVAIANSTDPNTVDGAKVFLSNPDKHVFHCFDYIRQGLMCNADMTLEWPRVEKNGARFAVDGWGIKHQCASWDAIQKWMEDNRFHQPWEKDTISRL